MGGRSDGSDRMAKPIPSMAPAPGPERRKKDSSAGIMPPRRSATQKANWLKAGPGKAFPSAKRSTNVVSSTHCCLSTKIWLDKRWSRRRTEEEG